MTAQDERRRSPRQEVDIHTLVAIDEREVHATIRNMSSDGVMLRVDSEENSKIDYSDAGRNIRFSVARNGNRRQFQGAIVRIFINDDITVIAARITEH